jgi:NAD-dependent deacetylase
MEVSSQFKNARNVVVLTGAGISAESGIDTFRDAGGLWENHAVEEVATPEGFAANPELVQTFYNARRRALLDGVEPNAGHRALALFEEAWRKRGGNFLLVTQNIDDLHERAGSRNLLHMHGELLKARCQNCDAIQLCREDLAAQSRCSSCDSAGSLRPHVVWFGEMPLGLEAIDSALHECDLFLSIGTSGRVYPAAGFVDTARSAGAYALSVNLMAGDAGPAFQDYRIGPAGIALPPLVKEILSQ